MTLRPMPVVMSSTLTQTGTEHTIRALEIGAVDFIGKPFAKEDPYTLKLVKNQLASKVKIAANSKVQARQPVKKAEKKQYNFKSNMLIAIGSSTGGVEANKVLLEMLPDGMPPIVITQHMPKGFTSSFARRLGESLGRPVHEATDRMQLQYNNIYIAPGDIHMQIKKKGDKYYTQLDNGDLYSGHRPSVDIMFKSIAEFENDKVIGVILTGMGKDGAEGLLEMKNQGAFTVGQNESSCIVYGMPKAAKANGAVTIELPLEKIADTIIKECLS